MHLCERRYETIRDTMTADAPTKTPTDSPPPGPHSAHGPWLLEVRAHRLKLIGLFAMCAAATPFILAMAVALIALLVSAIVQLIGRGHIVGVVTCTLLLLVIGPLVGAGVWIVIWHSLGLWRCLRHKGAVVRADDHGVEMFNSYAGRWERLAWADVGTVGRIEQSVAVEHLDPAAWEARQTWFKRKQARLSRRMNGMSCALSFGLPLEESASGVLRRLAALRDAKQLGHAVVAADSVSAGSAPAGVVASVAV